MNNTIRAIDGGGNGFRRADVTPEGEVLNFVARGPVNSVQELVNFAVENILEGTEGISYAIAALVEDGSTIAMAPNIHVLNGIDLVKETSKYSNLNTLVVNDIEAAVKGMALLMPEEDYFMGITWSSGIGVRVWNGGQILRAAEGGHMVLDPSDSAPMCGCGKRGHAEAIIGGDAIRRRVLEATKINNIKIPSGEPSKFLDTSWAKGDAWAVEMYKDIAESMGLFLANIQSLLHVPLIVWKGTFAEKALFNLEPQIRASMKEKLIEPEWASSENLRFILSPELKHDALIGAAKIFRETKP